MDETVRHWLALSTLPVVDHHRQITLTVAHEFGVVIVGNANHANAKYAVALPPLSTLNNAQPPTNPVFLTLEARLTGSCSAQCGF